MFNPSGGRLRIYTANIDKRRLTSGVLFPGRYFEVKTLSLDVVSYPAIILMLPLGNAL